MAGVEVEIVGVGEDSLREAFGRTLVKLADKYRNFVVFDGDVAAGTGTHHFMKSNPDRFYQFGIAEQNMIAAAAGFSTVGVLPFVCTFAVFTMRAYEQVRLSIAYAKRNVKLIASHVGLDVGPDGASAQAGEDLAAFRAVPGMVVVSPADPIEVEKATEAILNYDGPVYMRTGRSPCPTVLDVYYKFELGKGKILRDGTDVTVVACGVEVARALAAAEMLQLEGISVQVVNMATIKPIDTKLLAECAGKTGRMVTAEDHNIYGGLGSAVAEALAKTKPVPMEFVGHKDVFGESGESEELAEKYGIDKNGIARAVTRILERTS